MRTTSLLLLLLLLSAAKPLRGSPLEGMIRLSLDGRQVEGLPLAWDENCVRLLGRDGRLWEFNPTEAADFRQTSRRFQSYTVSEFRALLLRELAGDFEVSGAGPYLIAHPRHQGGKWAHRFEDLYRSFVHYFSLRGVKLDQPLFPLVGIVCRDRSEFQRLSSHDGAAMPGILGVYLTLSNRIILYDMGGGENSQAWKQNASVLIHEATHQMAFNTGVHSRYTPPPRWVAEGLATMFEASGVYDSRYHPAQSERINRGRLKQFRELVPRHRPELIEALVTSDDLFRLSPAAAYAEAWALTFYLMENHPRKYAAYLALTGRREPFAVCSSAMRRGDFVKVFGDDWRMLEAQFLRFMNALK